MFDRLIMFITFFSIVYLYVFVADFSEPETTINEESIAAIEKEMSERKIELNKIRKNNGIFGVVVINDEEYDLIQQKIKALESEKASQIKQIEELDKNKHGWTFWLGWLIIYVIIFKIFDQETYNNDADTGYRVGGSKVTRQGSSSSTVAFLLIGVPLMLYMAIWLINL